MIKDGSPPLMILPPQTRQAKRGHADWPGSGPAGETCGSCRHLTRVRTRSMRTFFKCGLTRHTAGAASDIRCKDPACSRWQADDA